MQGQASYPHFKSKKTGLNRGAARWIKRLNLKKHPEGGYFCETYRSEISFNFPGHDGLRNSSSAIYYLLVGKQISRFHRLRSDEIWHHYAGGPLSIFQSRKNMILESVLGTAIRQSPQLVVEKNTWVAASVRSGSYSLVGCTVSPGFDFRDWEIGTRADLASLYPEYKDIIERYTTV